jgi:hypothetical protein
MNTRKKLRAEIATMTHRLHQQQIQVRMHQRYFKHKRLNGWIPVGLLIFVVWLGWKASKGKWLSKIAIYLMELITLLISTYFRTQVMNVLGKSLFSVSVPELPRQRPKDLEI